MAPGPQPRILALNRGSSTLKAALYAVPDATGNPQLVLTATAAQAASSSAHVQIKDSSGTSLFEGDTSPANDGDLALVLDWLTSNIYEDITAIGHRIVHGGSKFTKPQLISEATLSDLARLFPLDPDHLPTAVAGIRLAQKKFPAIPQVACFDTAFHASLPLIGAMYALPRRFYETGLRRYGFHGLSYEYILHELETLEPTSARRERVIIAHLGSGASITAIRNGHSIDTSMGFTPLEGLVMARRSGDIDPGAVLFMMKNRQIDAPPDDFFGTQMSPDDINELLNKKSGLLGISGISDDMRELLEKSTSDEHAAAAVDLFCYRAKKYIGAYSVALGGLDTLIFTAGIGEHAPKVRQKICEGLEFLGVELDPSRNQNNDTLISSANSPVKIRVIPTNEELTIVRHLLAVLGDHAVKSPAR